ncbi:MAG: very short patch repair endonuclease [Pseudomonadota bacterium]
MIPQRRPYKNIERRLAGSHVPTTDAHTSQRMGRIRQRGTTPELTVRRVCAALGVRYRLHNCDLPGSPDIANRRQRWAIFVHGCFWHRHAGCRRATLPKSNTKFWQAKFERNEQRDAAAVAELTASGYRVLTLWECETAENRALESRLREFFGGIKDRRT